MPDKGNPILVGAGATVEFSSSCLVGFLCTTSGSITINRLSADGSTTLVNALAVTAGQWVDIPMVIGTGRGQVVSAGGAIGTLLTK